MDNEDSVIRCFHWIDSEGDGVVTEEELANAFVEYEDRAQKKAKLEATEIMNKIDFNNSKDIDYSCRIVILFRIFGCSYSSAKNNQ